MWSWVDDPGVLVGRTAPTLASLPAGDRAAAYQGQITSVGEVITRLVGMADRSLIALDCADIGCTGETP